MNDLITLGYPPGYHLGVSLILWVIAIICLAVMGLKLYLNAKKTYLINGKEMFKSNSILYFSICVQFSLISIGASFPENFLLFYSQGNSISVTSGAFYFFYWEKNLTSVKRIPTISTGIASLITLINVFLTIFFKTTFIFVIDYLSLMVLTLLSLSSFLYIYLIYKFVKNVKGMQARKTGLIWSMGMAIYMLALFFEFPPGVRIVPTYLAYYFAPILTTISEYMFAYGVSRLFLLISLFYTQTQRCAVHRGSIGKGSVIFYCPSCKITYCERCYEQVIKKDGCWNCGEGAVSKLEKKWEAEKDIKVDISYKKNK